MMAECLRANCASLRHVHGAVWLPTLKPRSSNLWTWLFALLAYRIFAGRCVLFVPRVRRLDWSARSADRCSAGLCWRMVGIGALSLRIRDEHLHEEPSLRIVLAAKVMRRVDAFQALPVSEPSASHPQHSGPSPGQDNGPESSPMERGRFPVHDSGRESQRHPRQLEIGDLLARCVLEAKVVCVFVSRSSSALGHAAKKASGFCASDRSCSTSSIICALLSSSSASFSK